MKVEEAIRILEKQKLFSPLGQASFVAIEALKKQIPQEIEFTPAFQTYFSAGDEAEPYCPACGHDVNEEDRYCPACGQKLDLRWR